jgi:hypothetical protein
MRDLRRLREKLRRANQVHNRELEIGITSQNDKLLLTGNVAVNWASMVSARLGSAQSTDEDTMLAFVAVSALQHE